MRESTDMAADLAERVTDVVVAALVDLPDVDLHGVTVRGSGRSRVVEVTVDRPGGISVDGCADVARVVSRALDADEPFDGPYRLDVASPGAERPLRTRADFERALGMRARVKAEGASPVEGVLAAVSAPTDAQPVVVTLTRDDGTTADVELDCVVRARTVLVWGDGKSGNHSSQARRKAP
jgi:ribosome maturation factor RimP